MGQGITTGGIAGTVVDPGGAVIANATVTAISLETSIQTVQHSRATGEYTIVNLPPGDYSLKIEASGFETLKIEKVTVSVGTTALGPEALKVGSKGETVLIAGDDTPLISTTQSQVSSTIGSDQLTTLPFGGGFDTAALLSTGMAITHSNDFSNSNGSYGGFSSQGERGRSNNFEIDGQSNNDNSVAGPQVFFSNQDAISSIEVITNNFSAQYGRNAGSVVNYITKAGSNSFHGTGFEWYEGNWGESFAQGQKNPYQGYCPPSEKNNCLNVPTSPYYGEPVPSLPRYVDNDFGGSFGGPIIHDKLFFFTSALFNRYRNGGGTSLSGASLTPTPDGIADMVTDFPGAPGVAALANNGPYSVKTGNPHVSGPITMIPVTMGTGTPVPIPFSAIARSVPSLSNDEEILARLDFQATQKDHFFARYFYQDDPTFNAGGSVVEGAWYNVPDTAHSAGADWEHTFGPNWVNQLRYSFQQTSLLFQGGGQPNCTAVTPADCTSTINISSASTSAGKYSMLSFGYPDNIPQGRVVKVTQVQDNATWTVGKQNILFGGEYDYQNSPNPFLPYYNGGFNFSGTSEYPSSFDDFINGVAPLNLGNGNFTSKFKENDFAFYFQDDWKVSPKMTLNLGMRYEFFGQAVNLLHDETVTREENPATAFWDQSLPLSVRTFPYTQPDYHNIQPRVGFAYNPDMGARKVVIRGGFAINFDPAFYNIFLNSATAAPVINLGTVSNCGDQEGDVQCLPSGGASGAQVRTQSLPYLPTGPGINPGFRNTTYNSPSFHNPYTESYLLGTEYGLGSHAALSVSYVGNHQVGNFQSTDGNPYLAPLKSVFPNAVPISLCADSTAPGFGRPDCTHANIRTRTNGAFAIYNSLQTRLTTRSWHGLTTELNWTYSKTIDNASEIFSTFSGGNTNAFAQNPLNTDVGERGVSGISLKHIVSSGFTYVLPIFPHGTNFVEKSLGGWRLNGIYTFDSGQPGAPLQYGFFGDGGDYQSYTADIPFMNWQISGYDVARAVISNPKAPLSSVGIYDPDGGVCGGSPGYYSWASCAPVTPSDVHWLRNTQGLVNHLGSSTPYIGSSRGTVFSQTWNNLDASLFKSFPITERVTLQLQMIAFNSLNRQYLGMPDLGLDDLSSNPQYTTFENQNWSYGSNRNTQIGAKFIF
jgi:hypothetical protein